MGKAAFREVKRGGGSEGVAKEGVHMMLTSGVLREDEDGREEEERDGRLCCRCCWLRLRLGSRR